MSFDLDSTIFIGFLIANLVFGLWSSRGIKNIHEYAIGDRNFSTATIAATIIATWVSGEFFFTIVSETYTKGLHIIWIAALGDFLCLLSLGVFFAPRMGEFLGKLSIAEAMGGLYGERVRVITAVAGFIGAAGLIAIQLKIAGVIFEYALELPSIYGVVSAAVIVTLYSALGGIKSVTFTDIIQFFTFGIVIPAIAYVLLTSIDNIDIISNTLTNNQIFDYKEVFDFSQTQSLQHLFLFLWFVIPSFTPAIFQRIAMAKNTLQVNKSFIIASITCLLLVAITSWIGILTLSINPSLNPNDVIKHIVFNSSFYIGLKGAMLAGIMAMIMSTVDSYINATSVLVVHDFCKPLKIKFIENELFSARIVSILIGVFSLILSLRDKSLLELMTITYSLYVPIVTIPFIMAILGFRSTEKSVILGMGAGLATVLAWDYVLQIKAVNSVPFGMLANLFILMGSHYLLKQKGGWVGIKDNTELLTIQRERKLKISRLLHSLKTFNILDICKKNCPKGEGLISILGIFVMVSTFSGTNTLAKEYQLQYAYLINILYPITLCTSTALISYPLWLPSWKDTGLIGICWNVIMFSVLICFSFLMVLISNFSEIQLMVFMVNIIMLSSLITWRWALFTITIGVAVTTFCYQQYISVGLQNDLLSSQFKIVYLLLLIISTLVTFLKPKQELQAVTEEKVDHLGHQMNDREEELVKSNELKYEFLRNLEHEAHTPITGITSMGQVLWENYDKLNEKQRRQAAEEIAKSSERLASLVNNMIDLSKLSSLTYKLNITKVNLSELVYKRLNACKKLYLDDKELEFFTEIEEKIIAYCDENYISSTIDNLIINSLQYSKEGKISIELRNIDDGVEFSIIDEGIGIPKEELYDIFGVFVVSSKTHTPAGGRGVGLALCKKVIEAHGGKIWAESDGIKGTNFKFTLPQYKNT